MRLVFCILLVNLANICSSDESFGDVVFANVLFRHGDRTPVEPYPFDPYRNESLWPVPFGQLTNTGKHQHLLLGRWLRSRYGHLLPQSYSLYDVFIRSTDVDRTLMSAEANLAGLYPPNGNQKWDIKNWMPIPVHTVPQEEDSVLAGNKFCDKYVYEYQRLLNSPEMRKINEENADLYKYLSDKTGKSIASLETVEYLYNTLYIEELYNKTLPEWTKSVYPDKLKPLAEKSFTTQAYNKILQRFKSGPLLKEMIEHMREKSKRALVPDRKLWIYSAHDDTVANFMMTLGIFKLHCPPYAVALLVELRINKQNEHVVTIFYKNSTGEPTLLTIPGCIEACPLNQFIRLTKSVVPDNWERECLMGFKEKQFNVDMNAIIAILTASVLMLIILVMVIVIFAYWHYKREHNQYYSRLSEETA